MTDNRTTIYVDIVSSLLKERRANGTPITHYFDDLYNNLDQLVTAIRRDVHDDILASHGTTVEKACQDERNQTWEECGEYRIVKLSRRALANLELQMAALADSLSLVQQLVEALPERPTQERSVRR